ncbi:MAG: deoxyribodipyrimidine photo-lyase [Bacteroidota bacterium]
MTSVSIFWFRRDLRLADNAGLYHALKGPNPVLPLFIFDKHILDKLEDRDDARVHFLHDLITGIDQELQELGSSIIVRYGKPETIWPQLLEEYDIKAVYANKDWEPYAHERDGQISDLLGQQGIEFHTFKDHVIFEGDEVLKGDGGPYTVFSPYSRKWRAKLDTRSSTIEDAEGHEVSVSYFFKSYPTEKYFENFVQLDSLSIPSLGDMDFQESAIPIPSDEVAQGLIRKYSETRNFPAVNGTSKLGIHFRFGSISIREKARKAQQLNDTYLNELIWRDFYAQILYHFPHVVGNPFREKYKFIEWRNNEAEFEAWCSGQTGYPIVDAGMRELNNTGYMHNRVRMIVASFLTKHLLIDWRWGEAYFARKLLDFDLASNNGGWQWAAGCGTDAAPYFRVFNPYSQQAKFDKDFKYIKRWVPEYGTEAYVPPIVEHKFARERCLAAYKSGLAEADRQLQGMR